MFEIFESIKGGLWYLFGPFFLITKRREKKKQKNYIGQNWADGFVFLGCGNGGNRRAHNSSYLFHGHIKCSWNTYPLLIYLPCTRSKKKVSKKKLKLKNHQLCCVECARGSFTMGSKKKQKNFMCFWIPRWMMPNELDDSSIGSKLDGTSLAEILS